MGAIARRCRHDPRHQRSRKRRPRFPAGNRRRRPARRCRRPGAGRALPARSPGLHPRVRALPGALHRVQQGTTPARRRLRRPCRLAALLLERRSPWAPAACELAARYALACAERCDGDEPLERECAGACRRFVEACRPLLPA
ncbi:four-helix bundle copper-binding protein [Pseudomonas aeruginosa]|uniref:four-helix bundle copper-binding protein n=1 Tax=Pseudomonas aeruginosa TaxID=287 RepID=UPI0034E94A88